MLHMMLLRSLPWFLLQGCMLPRKTLIQPEVQTLPQANTARQYGYEVVSGAHVSSCLLQVLQPDRFQYALAVNHDGTVFSTHPSEKVLAGSRQMTVDFPEDSAGLLPAALMFRLSDTVLSELLRLGRTRLELVKPYRVYEADGHSRMEAESLAQLSVTAFGDTLLPVWLNGELVSVKCRMAQGLGGGSPLRLFFSGEAENPLLLGWDYGVSVRLRWIDMPDVLPDPLALAPGSTLLYRYNHPVMLQGMWDYVDDSLLLSIDRADSLLQGQYRLSGKGCYPHRGRFSYTRGQGDEPVMRMIPEYTMEDCGRFGLVCGNWFLHDAQWNRLLNQAVVKLEVNENKNAQWFAPLLNEEAYYAFSRSLNMNGLPQDFTIIRLKDRMSETVLDVLPNHDNPLVVYWQEGTESLELVQVLHAKSRRKP